MKRTENHKLSENRTARREANNALFIMAVIFGLMMLIAAASCGKVDSTGAIHTLKVTEIRDDHTIIVRNLKTNKELVWKVENAYSQGYEIGQVINVYKR